jgi:hypothetical protein
MVVVLVVLILHNLRSPPPPTRVSPYVGILTGGAAIQDFRYYIRARVWGVTKSVPVRLPVTTSVLVYLSVTIYICIPVYLPDTTSVPACLPATTSAPVCLSETTSVSVCRLFTVHQLPLLILQRQHPSLSLYRLHRLPLSL